ncbi:UDP-N-acetylmuramoyl-tripeptide--D-alanyl-D- alanine ligase [Neochlamydia sp. AcF65]|nr:UDP-N-acetylmuramoyl-tripeptide--D-alanyl-D- alanine ligase [Neochlamydia sp. AcF65]
MHSFHVQELASIFGMPMPKDQAVFTGVSVDSRLHRPENLFFSLPGAQTDGHHFLEKIASQGSKGAVVSRDYDGPDYGMLLIRVENPLLALQNLARLIIKQSKARVVAVTGSVGKTTTKDFITTVLKEKFKVSSSPGNSNSQIGVPLAILNHTEGQEEIIVLEMGMSHPGNLKALIDIAPPECAIITQVALAHACNFDSLEAIAYAKAEILTHASTALAILHRDIINYSEIIKIGSCRKLSFSFDHPLADYSIAATQTDGLAVRSKEQIYKLGSFPILGKHHQANFLAAVACAEYFGMSPKEIALGMSKLVLPASRGQLIEKKGILFINDVYNASPLSVKAALKNIPSPKKGGRKIAVLADMLELGQFSKKAHEEIGEYALNQVDSMFCYGAESRVIFDCWHKYGRSAYWYNHRAELVDVLKSYLQEGDVVLIKGSKGTQISKLLEEWESGPNDHIFS